MSIQSFANPFRPYNPFIAVAEETFAPEVDLVEETTGEHVSYALVQSGPAVQADEVESHLDAVEVKVTWGAQVMSMSHLEAGKGFSIGEGGDFVLPELAKTAIVSSKNGQSVVAIPAGASAKVYARGESPRSVNGGDEIDLKDGMRVAIEIEPVTIEISAVRAGKKVPVGFLASLATGAAAAIGLSFVGHAAIVASLAMFMPKMNNDDAESISRDQVLKMQALLDSAADREQDRIKEESAASAEETGGGAQGGEPHKGDTGAAGTQKPVTTSGHMAFKGSDDRVQLSKKDEMTLATEGGFVGMLKSNMAEAGHTSPWGDTQMGQDSENKLGGLWGPTADDAMGYGLGLSGTGEGAGGKGTGIGIDGVGNTVGGGGGGPGKWGWGKGDKDGVGNGRDPGKGGHVAKAPKPPREGVITTNGHIPPEVIQRIVRQNFGRFRMCYEQGLRGNPTLQGRVVTKFVIGRDGLVAQAADGGSDLPNQEVVQCVVRSFNSLSFPQPEGGVATVSYPIILNPGD